MARQNSVEPHRGQHVRFIRYVDTRDGWQSQIIRGQLEERTDSGWRVRIVDDVRTLDRTEWSLYRE
ncbi:hypothetical protein [Rathayibacter sp. SD072]|uniref:hypothetical protein n=1 Tax=Rathayibacter sp. SD072 TaxID=2781731 RepID=UPI001A95999B|nr:hypothetical protein [Rathayibacter sp. SD072]MBO0982701.1 hypothetical protein [Rathayibacter sp. SD072]